MENHNWTGNDAGSAFGDPDLKDNPLAPYINGTLLKTSAHAEQYFNPPGNHPSQPNYLWLEAGTNFGVLGDTQPGQPQLFTHKHLTELLQDAGISWTAYAEPAFGSPVFDTCPIDFTYIDVEHLGTVYFNDIWPTTPKHVITSSFPTCVIRDMKAFRRAMRPNRLITPCDPTPG